MADPNSEVIMQAKETLTKEIVKREIGRAELFGNISEYPPWLHDGVSDQEIRNRNEYAGLTQEISRLKDDYSGLTFSALEFYLSSISIDSKRIRWLTVALVALTSVLAIITLVDILIRIGYIK